MSRLVKCGWLSRPHEQQPADETRVGCLNPEAVNATASHPLREKTFRADLRHECPACGAHIQTTATVKTRLVERAGSSIIQTTMDIVDIEHYCSRIV